MKNVLMVAATVIGLAGAGALIFSATDSIDPKHGVPVAIGCAALVGLYFWKGKQIGK